MRQGLAKWDLGAMASPDGIKAQVLNRGETQKDKILVPQRARARTSIDVSREGREEVQSTFFQTNSLR